MPSLARARVEVTQSCPTLRHDWRPRPRPRGGARRCTDACNDLTGAERKAFAAEVGRLIPLLSADSTDSDGSSVEQKWLLELADKSGIGKSAMYTWWKAFCQATNRASEDALPMTFVDYAELVWKRLDAKQTQQAVADAIGWSREAVKNYASLKRIDSDAWAVVGTAFQYFVPDDENNVVPVNGTTVPSPFTEGLLRNILDLEPSQQVEPIDDVVRAFEDLETAGLLVRDADAGLVYLPDYCARQFAWKDQTTAAKDWRVIEARKHIERLPASYLVASFLDSWPMFRPQQRPLEAPCIAPCQGTPHASPQASTTSTEREGTSRPAPDGDHGRPYDDATREIQLGGAA